MPEDFRSRAAFSAILFAAAIAVLIIVWNGRYILLLLFGGIVGALLLSIPTYWVQTRLHLPRSVSLATVLFAMAALLAGLAFLRGPALLHQFSALQGDLPRAAQRIVQQVNDEPWGPWLIAQISQTFRSSDRFSFAVSGLRGFMSVTTVTLAALVLVLFTSLFLASEPNFYLRGLRRLTPARHRPLLRQCLHSATSSLKSWLLARLLSMIVIGVMVAIGLWLLHIPLAGTLGIIAGLFTFIPNVGPVVSVIPAALLAFAISPGRGFLTVTLFGLVHFLEGNVVTPLAERKIVTLPPALTLSLQLLLASVTGLLGIAMAAPLTAVLLGVMNVVLPREGPEEQKVERLVDRSAAPQLAGRGVT